MSDVNEKLGAVDAGTPLSSVEAREKRRLDEQEMAYYISELWRQSKDYYDTERRFVWVRSHHCVYGRQWAEWNPIDRRWFPMPPLGRDRRSTSNHLLGRVTQMAAKLVSSKPSFTVLPSRANMESRSAAKLGDRVLDRSWKKLDLFMHRYFSILHMIIYGLGAMKVWFDPGSGPVDVVERPLFDPEGNPVPPEVVPEVLGRQPEIMHSSYRGRIRVEAVSPGELHPPPAIYWPLLGLCPWLIHETMMSPAEILERFGVEVDPQDTEDAFNFAESLSFDVDRFTFYGFGARRRAVDKVPVLEYYEPARPIKGWERGRVIITTENKVLAIGESQFDDGRYPFALFPGVPEPGRFFPHSWVSDLIDPQLSYNQTRSRLKKWEALLFEPKVLNPINSGISKKLFRSSLGVLDYDTFGGKPEWWTPPNPPESAYSNLQVDLVDMDKIAMQFGFARGEQQQGSPSGALAQLLVEADATELGPLLSLHARAWEQVGEGILELTRKYTTGEQLLAFAGEGGIAEVSSFKGGDIPSGLMVEVQEDSMIPRIKSARVQAMRELVREGFYGNIIQDQKTRRRLLEYAGQPVALQGADTPDMNARRIAEHENFLLIYQGQQVQRRPTDDDEIHLEVMLDRVNQIDTFEWTEEVWQLFLGHLQEHQQSLMAAQAAEEKRQLELVRRAEEAKAMAGAKGKVAEEGARAILAPPKQEPQPEAAGGA